MVQMIATKAHRYAGKKLAVGDKFEATQKDSRLLIAVHRAVVTSAVPPVPPPVPPTPTLAAIAAKAAAIQPATLPVAAVQQAVAKPAQPMTTRSLTAEKEADSEEAKKRAQYKRRDLTAD